MCPRVFAVYARVHEHFALALCVLTLEVQRLRGLWECAWLFVCSGVDVARLKLVLPKVFFGGENGDAFAATNEVRSFADGVVFDDFR